MTGSIQTFATLTGLVLDIVGVILLAREFIDATIGGTRKLVTFQRDLNVAHGVAAREALAKAEAAKAAGANWLALMLHEIALVLRRADARLYNENVRRDRERAGLPPLSIVGSDGFADEPALRQHSAELDAHYRSLGEKAALRPQVSRIAFGLIIAGFVGQFIGALPLGA